jgi:hypothetical protein
VAAGQGSQGGGSKLTTTEQDAGQAADFAAMASAIVGLAEALTGKSGTLALDQLVRQQILTQETAVRVWNRSGRKMAAVRSAADEIAELRRTIGFGRRPGELDNSGPRPVSRSVTFGSDDGRKRASAVAEERRYQREIAERGQLRPASAEFRERHPELNMTRPPGSDLYAEERARS